MEFILFRFFALLSVAFVASHAAASSEDYWRSVLPNTPMPKFISELLQSPEWIDDKSKVFNLEVKPNHDYISAASTDQHTDKDGNRIFLYGNAASASTDQHTSKDGNRIFLYGDAASASTDQHTSKDGNRIFLYGNAASASTDQHTSKDGNLIFTYGNAASASTDQHTSKDGNRIFLYGDAASASTDQHTSKDGNRIFLYGDAASASTDQHTSKDGNRIFLYGNAASASTDQHTSKDGNRIFLYGNAASASTDQHTSKDGNLIFTYGNAASVNQLHHNPNAALFFLEKDLEQGTNMNLHFTKSTTPTPFLPQNIADSIPFSSIKLPEILSKFSVEQNTLESETIKNTISACEAPGNKGEEKYCATSLEKMIDFTTSRLGKKVNALSTDVEKESGMQKYRILGAKKVGEEAVICHKQNYAYAVFYCHKTNDVNAYTVLLVGSNGTKAKAAAICHTDTSSWNPKHLAFQVLNVKPGSAPVCHFLPEDHVLWVPY
ncbi:BURP domain-containing protein [Heracleum sosnowskyi]|uniref:BURP domain-containing protein n=1 Tax=Heracleum sosnowskyi TaxID=360622 RepID=A0AAD8IBX5_9APIA|nr:BURP domain-containing protein [Heracleum sosnowskyi]